MRIWWLSEAGGFSFNWFGSVSCDRQLIKRLLELTDSEAPTRIFIGGGVMASNKFGPHRTNGKGKNSTPGNWAG